MLLDLGWCLLSSPSDRWRPEFLQSRLPLLQRFPRPNMCWQDVLFFISKLRKRNNKNVTNAHRIWNLNEFELKHALKQPLKHESSALETKPVRTLDHHFRGRTCHRTHRGTQPSHWFDLVMVTTWKRSRQSRFSHLQDYLSGRAPLWTSFTAFVGDIQQPFLRQQAVALLMENPSQVSILVQTVLPVLTQIHQDVVFSQSLTELPFLPSGKHTKSYWKWPFIVSFPINNGDFP